MNNKLMIWLQIIAAFGVLAGVVVVIYQLQETRSLVQAQIVQTTLIEINNEGASLFGENGAAAMAKACLDSSNLTDAEKFIVDTAFWNLMRRGFSAKRMFDASGLNSDWKELLGVQLGVIMSYPIGEEWLKRYKSSDSELQRTVQELLPSIRERRRLCSQRYEIFQTGVNDA
ncbi:MAG: hypothetical protein GKR90_02530 [Pseudomonadales bacterium]|nr:hypothetical protein [Pseudomonadales bacterium]